MASPSPTMPEAISLIPSVPLRTVSREPERPSAAALARAGRFSMVRLAAISSWLPSRSEPATAVFASARAWATARSL